MIHRADRLAGQEAWGKGLTALALVAFSKWAFDTNSVLERLYMTIFAENLASRRVAEKGGYTFDCVLRQAAIKHGKVIDEVLYSYLRSH